MVHGGYNYDLDDWEEEYVLKFYKRQLQLRAVAKASVKIRSNISLPHVIPTLPFADVIGCLFGKHPLLEHVVEGMDRA